MKNKINFTIGDYVIATRKLKNEFKKGEVFKVQGLRIGFCDCHKILVDIGVNQKINQHQCFKCKKIGLTSESRYYISKYFKNIK